MRGDLARQRSHHLELANRFGQVAHTVFEEVHSSLRQ